MAKVNLRERFLSKPVTLPLNIGDALRVKLEDVLITSFDNETLAKLVAEGTSERLKVRLKDPLATPDGSITSKAGSERTREEVADYLLLAGDLDAHYEDDVAAAQLAAKKAHDDAQRKLAEREAAKRAKKGETVQVS